MVWTLQRYEHLYVCMCVWVIFTNKFVTVQNMSETHIYEHLYDFIFPVRQRLIEYTRVYVRFWYGLIIFFTPATAYYAITICVCVCAANRRSVHQTKCMWIWNWHLTSIHSYKINVCIFAISNNVLGHHI